MFIAHDENDWTSSMFAERTGLVMYVSTDQMKIYVYWYGSNEFMGGPYNHEQLYHVERRD